MQNNKPLETAYASLCEKARHNLQQIAPEVPEYPGRRDGMYFAPGAKPFLPLSHIFCWTQSFFTGMGALALLHTSNQETLAQLRSFYEPYRAKVCDTPLETMHDLGFLYTLYSTLLWRITGDESMRTISIAAADALLGRFVEKGGFIRAWGRMDGKIPAYVDAQLAQDQFFQKSEGLAIVDCMMNLPLLFFAWEQTGDERYRDAAIAHADTTLRYFVREDDSVCHAYRFGADGAPVGEWNGCGYGIGSHWARGTSWAVYGFISAWQYTKDERYRDAAVRLARKFVSLCEPNGMPVWDFRLPPNTPAKMCGVGVSPWDETDPASKAMAVDSSAAVIVACALHVLGDADPILADYPGRVTQTLLEQDYLNMDRAVPGVLHRQNGNDTYTSFGDYFCMELLYRQRGGEMKIW